MGQYDKSLIYYQSILPHLKRHPSVKYIEAECEGVKKLVTLLNGYKPLSVLNIEWSNVFILRKIHGKEAKILLSKQ